MNSSIYVFGSLGNGYEQYPDDYAKNIFQDVHAKAEYRSQIIVHRENNLMYYYYIRKLDNEQHYIGLCILLNGIMFTQLSEVFTLFENAVTKFVETGLILKFDDNGNIVTSGNSLIKEEVEVERVSIFIQDELNYRFFHAAELPSNSYAISNHAVRRFTIDDKQADIEDSSYQSGFTLVSKTKGVDTDSINGYRGIIRRLNKEKLDAVSKYANLQHDYSVLKKQKEQYKVVLLLALLVVIVFIVFMLINNRLSNNLETTSSQLSDAKEVISVQNDSLYSKNSQIYNLNEYNEALNISLCNLRVALSDTIVAKQQAEKDLEELNDKLVSIQPLIIKSTNFSFNSDYLSLSYYGLCDTLVSIGVRVYNDNTAYYRTRHLKVYKGDNTHRIYLDNDFSSNDWYSFEILIGDKIIGGGRH